MANTYLSYKLEDKELGRQMAEELERLGHRVVYDAVALSAGTDWRLVLQRELNAADAVVVLLTERALTSPFVMGEVGAARAIHHAFGHLVLLPVLVGHQPIPPVISDLFVVNMPDATNGVAIAATEVAKALDEHFAPGRRKYPRVFISHRHSDAAVAEALVKALDASFDIATSDLRCTSVQPYTLRVGDRTPDRLRAELGRAEVVLGLLTPDTSTSSYVLFELGASWGRSGRTFPLLARGATSAQIPAPIAELHTLSLQNPAECHQLLDDLAEVTTLRRKERQGALVSQRIDALVMAASVPAGISI